MADKMQYWFHGDIKEGSGIKEKRIPINNLSAEELALGVSPAWEGILAERRMREFGTGAFRDADADKLDYEGFDSPLVTKRYAQYLHKHRKQADGQMRGSDNWQLGIPKETYVKSLVRHMEDVKLHWDGYGDEAVDPDFESAVCAVLFNAKGLLFELLKERRIKTLPIEE